MSPNPTSAPPRRDRVERILGRTLAFCVHPLAAWPILSKSWRALIVMAYVAAGYILTFGALSAGF